MKLSFDSYKGDSAKLIQWIVFIGLIAAIAWCFWVYYDTTQKLKETATAGEATPATVNEANLNKALEAQQQREENYQTPPLVSYDPFQ